MKDIPIYVIGIVLVIISSLSIATSAIGIEAKKKCDHPNDSNYKYILAITVIASICLLIGLVVFGINVNKTGGTNIPMWSISLLLVIISSLTIASSKISLDITQYNNCDYSTNKKHSYRYLISMLVISSVILAGGLGHLIFLLHKCHNPVKTISMKFTPDATNKTEGVLEQIVQQFF